MDWGDTPEEAAFRDEVRAFIRERFPRGYAPDLDREQSLEPEDAPGYNWPEDRHTGDPRRREAALEWARALAERGWVAPHWPREYGGAGLTVTEHFVFTEEMARAGVPGGDVVGVNLLGPTLIVHGTEEQRRAELPRILAGEVVWAQAFSEPGAGSDLASLKATARREGDSYVLDGQKIWISHAQYADQVFGLFRTDPEAPKHRGISCLMMPVETPGITVRPITDPRDAQPFNEVFFDDVKVPATNLIGEENRGWYVAMATLDFERSGIGGTITYQRAVDDLAAFVAAEVSSNGDAEHQSDGTSEGDARERPAYVRPDWEGGPVRLEVADRRIELEVLYALGLRTVSMQAAGQVPNYESSTAKLFGSEVHQRLARTGMKAFGPWAALWQRDGAPMRARFTHDYVDAVPHTVLSGSSEIMRNVIATRGLGLPRE